MLKTKKKMRRFGNLLLKDESHLTTTNAFLVSLKGKKCKCNFLIYQRKIRYKISGLKKCIVIIYVYNDGSLLPSIISFSVCHNILFYWYAII